MSVETFECYDGEYRTKEEISNIKKKLIDMEDRYLKLEDRYNSMK